MWGMQAGGEGELPSPNVLVGWKSGTRLLVFCEGEGEMQVKEGELAQQCENRGE